MIKNGLNENKKEIKDSSRTDNKLKCILKEFGKRKLPMDWERRMMVRKRVAIGSFASAIVFSFPVCVDGIDLVLYCLIVMGVYITNGIDSFNKKSVSRKNCINADLNIKYKLK